MIILMHINQFSEFRYKLNEIFVFIHAFFVFTKFEPYVPKL